MPASAPAPLRQTGGRSARGLVEPGKTVLVVRRLGVSRAQHDGAEAIKRAAEERGRKAIGGFPPGELLASRAQYDELRTAFLFAPNHCRRPTRKLEYFFHSTARCPLRKKWAANGYARKPDLANVTWPDRI